jgi:hypothetical protein
MPDPTVLPESISQGDPNHISHHEQIHAQLNAQAPIVQHYGVSTYTLALSDAHSFVEFDNDGSGVTITIPTNAAVAFPVGTIIHIFSRDVDNVVIQPDSGVNLITKGGVSGSVTMNGQSAEASLIKRADDWWQVRGDLL